MGIERENGNGSSETGKLWRVHGKRWLGFDPSHVQSSSQTFGQFAASAIIKHMPHSEPASHSEIGGALGGGNGGGDGGVGGGIGGCGGGGGACFVPQIFQPA